MIDNSSIRVSCLNWKAVGSSTATRNAEWGTRNHKKVVHKVHKLARLDHSEFRAPNSAFSSSVSTASISWTCVLVDNPGLETGLAV